MDTALVEYSFQVVNETLEFMSLGVGKKLQSKLTRYINVNNAAIVESVLRHYFLSLPGVQSSHSVGY